jgi:DNA processing protein
MADIRSDYQWIALNMIQGLGPARIKKLLEHFGSPEKIFSASSSELRKVQGIGKEFGGRISDFNPEKEVEKELSFAEEKSIKILTLRDEKYPARLKEIFDPPLVLYIKGDITPADEKAVAMVGTRYPSFYGKMVAEDLAKKFAGRGITVISGMARGIDSASHKGALAGGGRTAAVLGCGADVCYPPENAKIMDSIAESGAVISEFPLGTAPDKGNFPRRNRVISGMSMGVVVVEAAQKSGSLITASLALEQGRDVFAVPGKVDSPKSVGTNGLIKEGAKLVHDIEDVMEEIMPGMGCPEQGGGELSSDNNSLNPDEKRVLEKISSEPVHVDALCALSGLPAEKITSVLMMLEVKGLVKQLPGKQFARNTRK